MSKSRDIADSAATINFIDNVTSDVQTQINGLGSRGTLTKTFANNESASIALSSSALVPVVSVTKEVDASVATNNQWDVNSNTENYTRLDTAIFTTLDFTSGGSPFVLGSGSFSVKDIGKTIEANSGKFVLVATDGSFVETTAPTSYDQVAAGSWGMYGVVYNTADDDLEVSGTIINTFSIALGNVAYTQSFSMVAQDTNMAGLAFSPDGTKMFTTGTQLDQIYEYTLSTGFDVSTASFVQSFSVAAQDTAPYGIAFNPDGTKMFMSGGLNDSVYEYTLSTGFDIGTASYSQSVAISFSNTDSRGIKFNPDGTKLFIVSGAPTDKLILYTLSTGFDVSTASTAGNTLNLGNADSSPYDVAFSPDGTKLFMTGLANTRIYSFTLSTAYDILTATQDNYYYSVLSQTTNPIGIAFNDTGTKMFWVSSNTDTVYEYSIGSFVTPYGYRAVHTTSSTNSSNWLDINTMTADDAAGDGSVHYAISTDDRASWTVIDNTLGERDIVRNNSGTWQYNANLSYGSETWVNSITNTELAALEESMEVGGYSLADTTFVNSYSFSGVETALTSVTFSHDGVYMYIVGFINDTIYRYTLATPYDPTTIIQALNMSKNISTYDTNPYGLALSEDGSKLFVIGTGSNAIDQFILTTPFDISTLTFDYTFYLSSYDGVGVGFGFSKDGTKLYFGGQTNDKLYAFTLSTPWEMRTASFVNDISILAETGFPRAIAVHPTGTRLFVGDLAGDRIIEYALSTPYDISTATFTTSVSVVDKDNSPNGLVFSNDGSKMIISGSQNNSVYQFTTQALNPNRMTKTQLNSVTDLNHITSSNDLDLAIIFNTSAKTAAVPSSDGVSINYDANVAFKGAVLGTDYDFEAPSGDSVTITALAANNLKVRVL